MIAFASFKAAALVPPPGVATPFPFPSDPPAPLLSADSIPLAPPIPLPAVPFATLPKLLAPVPDPLASALEGKERGLSLEGPAVAEEEEC